MKTIIRNFLTILRRFRMATVLNILGLSVAFAAFIVLMMQVRFDWGFDKFHKEADCIYRLGLYFPSDGNQVIHARPFADAFIASSPHIKKGALLLSWGDKFSASVERGGEMHNYRVPEVAVSEEFIAMLNFNILEGDAGALQNPQTVLIPQSMAKLFFGDDPAVGKQLKGEGKSAIVGGVYADFPKNSIVENDVYKRIPAGENADNWNMRGYQLFVLLDSPKAGDEILANFKSHFNHEGYDWKTVGLRLTQLPDIYYENDAKFDSQKQKGSRAVVLLLFTIALLIVALAGINFTNFSNAIAPMRMRSVNTQKVLGSSDLVLRGALLAEAVGICLFSFALSLVLVRWASFSWLSGMIDADMALHANIPLLAATGVLAVILLCYHCCYYHTDGHFSKLACRQCQSGGEY